MSREDPVCAKDYLDFISGYRWLALAHCSGDAVTVRLGGTYYYFDYDDAKGFAEKILAACKEWDEASIPAK